MKIKEYNRKELKAIFNKGGNIVISPFIVNIQSSLPEVTKSIECLYSDYELITDDTSFTDFYVNICSRLFRWGYKPQARFYTDGRQPFLPLPLSQAFPFFEWGLNWCIAQYINTRLIIHSAVVEKNSQVFIFPGIPGAGKSTLCAALINRGWRLLSDEMAMVDLDNYQVTPIVRPVGLKNESIDIIKSFAPDAVFGKSFLDTSKGTVAHLKPSIKSVEQSTKKGVCRWVIFPEYVPNAKLQLVPISSAESVLKLAGNSFNYNVLGGAGFEALCSLVEKSESFSFTYSCLDEAIMKFNELVEKDGNTHSVYL